MRKITRFEIGNELALRLPLDDGSTRVFNMAPLVKTAAALDRR